jgi:hypothetical protein
MFFLHDGLNIRNDDYRSTDYAHHFDAVEVAVFFSGESYEWLRWAWLRDISAVLITSIEVVVIESVTLFLQDHVDGRF